MADLALDLSPNAQTAIADALNQSVAETAVTTMMAQNFHWNVEGMAFGPLHELFQTIYEDHFTAQDDLAERIKAIDMHAEGTLAGMINRSKVVEAEGAFDASEMLQHLLKAQMTLAKTLRGAAAIAEEHGDLLTQDLAIERGREHEKFAWMLRAHLKSA
ncbi:Dps family protein [Pontivivens insulae]|uniref:General stress protein 20U n=1 Tax=Pontivivens insulae TaxID=1639689 RepID=A0A2R8A8W6_9RHOB|nr:DNA starvation/stationary phase protection protein [Pontivivens insulae]RED18768.1 starvation-inducible DNA-binding protein [Pontivivens insulae]SPF28666.1 General stress protein 20U [Pontivivens insulae]